MSNNWEDVFQIQVLRYQPDIVQLPSSELYTARIRNEGLTSYGNTYEDAIAKVIRMKAAKERLLAESKNTTNAFNEVIDELDFKRIEDGFDHMPLDDGAG